MKNYPYIETAVILVSLVIFIISKTEIVMFSSLFTMLAATVVGVYRLIRNSSIR